MSDYLVWLDKYYRFPIDIESFNLEPRLHLNCVKPSRVVISAGHVCWLHLMVGALLIDSLFANPDKIFPMLLVGGRKNKSFKFKVYIKLKTKNKN